MASYSNNAWREDTWLCKGILEKYFGKANSIEELVYQSQWLQCEGYKAIFEEARRQKPFCSMALNWCYNEPWKTAANNSIISYPHIPKPSYYSVKNSLRHTLISARIQRFDYIGDDEFTAELWVLNDSNNSYSNLTVKAYICIDNTKEFLLEWETGEIYKNENKKGHTIRYKIPNVEAPYFILQLECSENLLFNSEYKLKLEQKKSVPETRTLN